MNKRGVIFIDHPQKKFRIKFLYKIIGGFGMIGVLIVLIFILGNQALRQDSILLKRVVQEQVYSLAKVNHLQSHASKIRLMESNLPRLKDFFAITGIINALMEEADIFEKSLGEFISGMKVGEDNSELSRLSQGWKLYRKNLDTTLELVKDMKMAAAEDISIYSSRPCYQSFAKMLEEVSNQTALHAQRVYELSVKQQEKKRLTFLWISIIGLVLAFIFVFLLYRSLSQRIELLTRSAVRLAEGGRNESLPVKGNDEISALAAAFNVMQANVQNREDALQDAHDQLEQRVSARTSELAKINDELNREIQFRRESEEALRKSEASYRGLVEQLPAVIYTAALDKSRKTFFISPQIEKMLGFNADEWEEGHDTWFQQIYPEDREQILQEFENACRNGLPFKAEYRMVTRDNRIIWINDTADIVRDDEGRPLVFQGIMHDISSRKQIESEKKKLESQLRQALKMEAIGTLAGGIAHDFNNILGIIVGYTDLAILDIPESNQAYSNLLEVRKACSRAKDLVKQILSFSRQSEQELKPVKISMIVKETFKLLRSTIPTTIELQQKITNKADTVLADPTQIHQLIINLCTNAAHAMREHGGCLDISLVDIWLNEIDVQQFRDLAPGPYIKLNVSDTGHGIKPDILDRIFDPYFTTKEKGEGTGMGLAVVLGIVKNHNGAITVESQPGKGTTFHVLLPAIERTVKTGVHELVENLPHGNERILFVDDEDSMVKLVTKMLNRLGYDVTANNNSRDALACFRKDPGFFDLVITDMTMPGMTGDKLAVEILGLRPDIPIILCTGFSERISEERAKEIGIRKYILKPVVMEELARVLREIFEA